MGRAVLAWKPSFIRSSKKLTWMQVPAAEPSASPMCRFLLQQGRLDASADTSSTELLLPIPGRVNRPKESLAVWQWVGWADHR